VLSFDLKRRAHDSRSGESAVMRLFTCNCMELFYGFVDHKPADLTNARGCSLSWCTINSAKSSGCSTFSGLPSVKFSWYARSVATVLGVSVVTRILCLRTSCIIDSERPINPNFEALYAAGPAQPPSPAVDEILTIALACCSIMPGRTARDTWNAPIKLTSTMR